LLTSRRGRIRAAHVWKRFRADRHRLLLRDHMQRIVGGPRAWRGRGWRWALRDVDLTVEPGESVGLVGLNGSGKTTLLKTLARVMYPYAGSVEVGGRVGALIEVTAGIHPDLSGRENVLLQGSLLGLRRAEVMRRFDDIVGFAELEDAIDRQVKFYSRGMQARLGFAIAAFLEPDILLVDEVLAVGDSAFQQKCLDRMRDVLNQGTTVVFVSHDLTAVESLCRKGVWLSQGVVQAEGPVRRVLGSYRRVMERSAETDAIVDGIVRVLKTEATGPAGGAVTTQERLEVTTLIESPEEHSGIIYLGVSEGPAEFIFVLARDIHLSSGETHVSCAIPHLPLPRGQFYLWMGIFDHTGKELLSWHPAAHFQVAGPNLDVGPLAVVRLSPVHVDASWTLERSQRARVE
jgi:ABC-type polysaccharide/polyol phosphate transport system ATPase subunit